MTDTSIRIRNLQIVRKRRRQADVPLVKGVDLDIPKGKIVGIVGESGSGKSLTMKSVLSILPKELEVSYEQLDVNGQAAKDWDRLPVSMIFQDPMTSLNPLRKIGYHLQEIVERFHPDLSRKEQEEMMEEMIGKVGIDRPKERLNQYPFEFSGGMRQRIMIAMALLANPEVLIADEPTTALDVTIQAQILALVKDLQANLGLTVVIVSHDFGVIAGLCDEVKVMRDGLFVEEGTVEDIFYHAAHPYTQELLAAAQLKGTDTTTIAVDQADETELVALSHSHRVRRKKHESV
ncbi:ABC transporter ATP-binding protein [Streptococcus sp. DD13]|uniref:ABC transporter ATP-binding protein n=1 Tax=Streptococcus sp. DD13 TaxID=1777881 RepID=UPI000799BFA4|nr:ABC transporter ATP-binding protein [Streptococcus sp. DD13]KXT78158.1 Oligopeptide transport ATP-binding protein OppD [Streptococcus sp. DD13]